MTDFDIFTNRVPWALLTDDEREQFMAYEGPLMKYDHIEKDWTTVLRIQKVGGPIIYRAAPRKPEIPWEHIHPRWNAWAMDQDGKQYFYNKEPELLRGCWDTCSGAGVRDDFLAIDTTGVDWRDSLVIRPGYEADND